MWADPLWDMKDPNEWHRWFAWRPARLLYEINESPGYSWVDSGNYAWLRWIERRWENDEWQHRAAVAC